MRWYEVRQVSYYTIIYIIFNSKVNTELIQNGVGGINMEFRMISLNVGKMSYLKYNDKRKSLKSTRKIFLNNNKITKIVLFRLNI